MAVPVAGHRHRVDREHLAPGGPQGGDQQPARCLDRDWDRRVGVVAHLGEQFKQAVDPGRVVVDSSLGEQLAVGVDDGYVVVVFRPVDPAEYRQVLASPLGRVEPGQATRAP